MASDTSMKCCRLRMRKYLYLMPLMTATTDETMTEMTNEIIEHTAWGSNNRAHCGDQIIEHTAWGSNNRAHWG